MALAIPRRLYADFYNKIGTFRTCVAGLTMSVAGGKAEVPELGHDFRF
jgi:hypothetical protein